MKNNISSVLILGNAFSYVHNSNTISTICSFSKYLFSTCYMPGTWGYCVHLFLESSSREKGKEEGRETERHQCERHSDQLSPAQPPPGSYLQPRMCPWLAIKPETFVLVRADGITYPRLIVNKFSCYLQRKNNMLVYAMYNT